MQIRIFYRAYLKLKNKTNMRPPLKTFLMGRSLLDRKKIKDLIFKFNKKTDILKLTKKT